MAYYWIVTETITPPAHCLSLFLQSRELVSLVDIRLSKKEISCYLGWCTVVKQITWTNKCFLLSSIMTDLFKSAKRKKVQKMTGEKNN